MTGVLEVRKEIHNLIDNLPEKKLYALRPLLDILVDEDDDVLSEDESILLEKCREERKEHPENFTPWAAVKAGKGSS